VTLRDQGEARKDQKDWTYGPVERRGRLGNRRALGINLGTRG